MSARDDLAELLYDISADEWRHHSPNEAADAIIAAGYVKVSEAAIERAAIQVFALNFDPATWSWKSHENDRQSCRNLVRAVVAALREES